MTPAREEPMTTQQDWLTRNQSALMAELARIRAAIERVAGERARVVDISEAADAESCRTLDHLCAAFGLSAFERQVLLLCAGVELDSSLGPLCAAAQSGGAPQPTFSLALNALPDAHWSAISPEAPLRWWRLIELASGSALTSGPLRIDERILHFLTGVDCLDDRVAPYIERLATAGALSETHRKIADAASAFLADQLAAGHGPAIHLCGADTVAMRGIASRVGETLEAPVYSIAAGLLPISPLDHNGLLRLLEREAALTNAVLYVDWHGQDPHDTARADAVSRLVRAYRGALVLASPDRQPGLGRLIHAIDVEKPEMLERHGLWIEVLGPHAVEFQEGVRAVLPQFALSAAGITAAGAEAIANRNGDPTGALWEACKKQARPRMDNLAQRVKSTAGWDDIVLPPAHLATLREIAAQVRNRFVVYDEWRFGRRDDRGLGISALFAGPSGTGKTLAAEVLANELNLDLYRIDLSQVVSKYIGETEENLRKVFDAAEEGGAVLLFDEADAIFGKRSEVKDSHDRYANLEVSYLLQRMEGYRGLAILTTNLKSAIDTAFHRRLRFILQFSFPDAAQRIDIWKRSFPPGAPLQNLQYDRLARLNLAGGNIRNAAISAAFLAAEAGEPIRMAHLARSCRSELAKLERPVSESEFGDWI